MAYHCPVECLNVLAYGRIAPDRRRQHQADRLACAGVDPPNVAEERQGAMGSTSAEAKDAASRILAASLCRRIYCAALSQDETRPPGLDRTEHMPEVSVPVKFQPGHIR